MTKTIYISGKVSGLPLEEVIKKFATAQTKLEGDGYSVINPVEKVIEFNAKLRSLRLPSLSEEADRSIILTHCLEFLLTCNAIYLLDDWLDSEGAIMERTVAKALGMLIVYEGKEGSVRE